MFASDTTTALAASMNLQLAQLLAEHTPVAMAVCDRDMRYLWHNHSWLSYHALGNADLLGRSHYDVFPQMPPEWRAEHRRVLAGATVQRERQRFVLDDGSEQWMRQTLRPWRDDSGEIRGLVLAAEVMTPQVHAEDALRATQQRFRAVFDSMFQFTGLLSADGTVLEINQTWLRTGGMKAADVIGRPFWRAPCWDPGRAAQDQLRAAIANAASGRFVRYEAEMLTGRRRRLPIDFSLKPVTGEHGEVAFIIPEARDITERREAELALRESSARFRAAQALTHVGSWEWNVPSGAMRWSDEQYRIFGYSFGTIEPTYDLFIEAVHDDDRDRVAQALRDTVLADVPVDVEYRLVRPNGDIRHVHCRGMADRGDDGRAVLMEGSLLDVTERKRAAEELAAANATIETERALLAVRVEERTRELTATMGQLGRAREEAERANEAKSAFLAAMSHEIRTPMNGVLGAVDLLRQSRLGADQSELAEVIEDSASSLLRILDDILDFSKVEAGQLELECEPLLVTDVVERVCDALYLLAERTGVVLSCYVDPLLPQLVGDPVRIRQILNNLVGNAIKFSSAQGRRGRVRVRAQHAGRRGDQVVVRLTVQDNGIGMAPQAREQLFRPFTQADGSTTRRFGGTGLGLSICRHLTDLMQGSIDLESTPGRGTTFTVDLPLDIAPAVNVATPRLDDCHCIVVSPDVALAQDWQSYLEHAGAWVDRITTLEALRPLLESRTRASLVTVVDGYAMSLDPSGWRELATLHAGSDTAFVWLGHGLRRRPRSEIDTPARVISLDRDVLHRAALLRAVALASGRTAEELDAQTDAVAPVLSAPSVDPRRQLLVVEDNEVNQKLLAQQLAMLGYAAEIVSNGREALSRWRSGEHALLLTDLHMPEMDGYELAAAIRREAPERPLPIIAFTANALRGEAARCMAVGMNDYLSKPVQLATLKATLEKWLPPEGSPLPRPVPSSWQPAGGDPTRTLDVGVLEQLVGDEPALIAEFLHAFAISLRKAMPEVRDAAARNDWKSAGATAHRIKSSARSVGAAPLGDLCAALEDASRCGNDAVAGRLAAQFQEAAAQVLAAIDARNRAQAERG